MVLNLELLMCLNVKISCYSVNFMEIGDGGGEGLLYVLLYFPNFL